MYDIIIKNGTLFKGDNQLAQKNDLGIKDGRIVFIGDLKNEKAKTEINAESKFVAPGFIDIHNDADHSLNLLFSSSAENLIRQGVTTAIGGNCGASLAPLISGSLNYIKRWSDFGEINVNWRSVKDFFDNLDKRKIGINFGMLIGWGTLRTEFSKGEFRNLTKEEMEKLKLLIKKSLAEGALGVSFGLGYPAEKGVGKKEILAIGELVKNKGGYLSFHLRDSSENFLASVNEIFEISKEGNLSVEISHFKAEGRENSNLLEGIIETLSNHNESEELINLDISPYNSEVQAIYSVLPEWVAVGGRKVFLKNITGEDTRKKIIQDLKKKKYLYKKFLITDSGRQWWFSGKSLEEISKSFNLSPEESLLKVAEVCDEKIIIFGENIYQEDIDKIIENPYSFICTNGEFYNPNKSAWFHPKLFGTFPRFLERYVKEKKLLSWEEAIFKITGKVAKKIGLRDRGLIKENYFADVVIFNPEKIKDKTTIKNPLQYPEGIETVIINGNLAYYKGVLSSQRYGKTIRRLADK